jgi:ATP-binding cassette, subfamily C, bacterial CydC
MNKLLRILRLWRGRTGWLLAGMVVSLAALAAGVGLMAVAGATLATAVAVTGALFAPAPVLLRGLGCARVVLRYLERLITHAATFRALTDLRVWFFRGLARSGAGGLGFRQAGDMLSRLVGDIEALDGLYLRILLPLAGAVLLVAVVVIFVGTYSIPLAIGLTALLSVGAFGLPLLAARTTAARGAALASASAAVRIVALDALSGLREVRAFSAEGRMLAIMQARETALLSAQRALASRTTLAGAGAFLCGQIAIFAVLVVAGANPAAAIATVFLILATFEAVSVLPRAGALAGHVQESARRVLEAAEAPATVPDPRAPCPLPSGFTLRFENIHFRWRPDAPPVFNGLTIEVPERARVALLGPSGTGKSTLAALALRVAAPQQGRILLGGTDITELSAADLHTRMGWLSQATHLFDDTIRANLLLARPRADEASLWAALDAAHVGDLVRALPDRLDTWVGEGGARLSGGQARRLALARTLLASAPIVILDEPCAGLDSDTERAFLTTLNEVGAERTIVLITHRLVGVERLDRIWRLSAGKAMAAAA